MEQVIHGDLLLRRVEADSLPAEVRGRLDAGRQTRVTLALGEATGHAHVLESSAPIGYVRDSDSVAYVLLRDTGLLRHEGVVDGEGHGTRTLDPAFFVVEHERDYDPTEYERRVAD